MTGFHWTPLEIASLAVAVFFVAGWVLLERANRRDNREIDAAIAADEERRARLAPPSEAEATAGIADLEAYGNRVYELGSPLRERNRRLDDLAVKHPMPKRPAPPAADPGEPWQLEVKNDILGPRLVEQPADSESNLGDQS